MVISIQTALASGVVANGSSHHEFSDLLQIEITTANPSVSPI
jgi:hypothetical protein